LSRQPREAGVHLPEDATLTPVYAGPWLDKQKTRRFPENLKWFRTSATRPSLRPVLSADSLCCTGRPRAASLEVLLCNYLDQDAASVWNRVRASTSLLSIVGVNPDWP
jgi:hypothetical protein